LDKFINVMTISSGPVWFGSGITLTPEQFVELKGFLERSEEGQFPAPDWHALRPLTAAGAPQDYNLCLHADEGFMVFQQQKVCVICGRQEHVEGCPNDTE